jgi:hypothetical protein
MHGGCHFLFEYLSPIKRGTMHILSSLALACAVLCCGCATMDTTADAPIPDSGALQAERRGIIGEVCPPALAAKGYC